MSELKTDDSFKFIVIVSDENPDQKFILQDDEPLILGKKQLTGIVNHRMSKNQMKIIADYSTSRVWVQQLGNSRSAVNNETMTKGEKRLLSYGDKITLLYKTNHTYHLDFLTPTYGIDYDKNNTLSLNEEIIPKIPLSNSTLLWDDRDDTLLVFNSSNIVHKDKIAVFDMVGMMIVALSGEAFPDDEDNWPTCNAEVIRSIKKLSDNDYKIVLFTYQGDIVGNIKKKNTFQKKIENIPKLIKTPVQVFIATRKDIYKKPAPGMWNILVSDFNGGISVDMENSFFCGGEAGRPAGFDSDGKPIKKDHSCSDRLFAINIGLKFYTPEEYFWKESTAEVFALPAFNSNDISSNIRYTDLSSTVLFSSKKEMIIMVGCPGSGKSYFAANKLICHDRMKIINRDILGSWQKCIAKTIKYLSSGSLSVVIDNRHPDVASRKQFIEIAKNLKVPCRVFLMKVSKEHAKHNSKFRELTDKLHTSVSEGAIDLYFSKFQKPTKKEGIKEIVPINFVPHFKDHNHEKLYKMFLL
ncbi:uncharacterized protein F21D5.5-like [Metopolophium dirhodum]|uniref:uncharacterized protein F21D5.5-like n=1 Tax=Metopolophium dirhodum TaxID=44670 RepID=UPI0029900860|nr:uncharacterized protein F21D5.5-like [Metopolophium dirhodum]